jgi:hypothetical protein
LIDVGGSQENHGVVKDNTTGLNIVLSDFVPFGGSASGETFSWGLFPKLFPISKWLDPQR